VAPKLTPLQPTKEFTGRMVTKDPVKVIPQVTGRILARGFKDGERVEEGKTVLFRLDPVLYAADVQKAKADIAKAKADIANWTAQIERDKAEFARVKQQIDSGVGAKTDLDKAAANVKVSEAQLDVSKAAKDSGDSAFAKAEENLKYCTIYAPTSGLVGQSSAAPGALVDAYKTELVVVYPVNEIYAMWEVDELTSRWYRDQIEAGLIPDPRNPATRLSCTIKLKGEKDFTNDPNDRSRNSVVDYVDPIIVRETGTRTIRATFENVTKRGPKGDLLPPLLSAGDSFRVRLAAGPARNVIAVPEVVVFSQQRKQYVYVVVEGKAQLREVEPGATFAGLVEINRRASPTAPNGLDESDVVIADNLLRVRPGIPVTVKGNK
jgi:RND family efflux transporter MFP subunit